jgi:hypothetical protein
MTNNGIVSFSLKDLFFGSTFEIFQHPMGELSAANTNKCLKLPLRTCKVLHHRLVCSIIRFACQARGVSPTDRA